MKNPIINDKSKPFDVEKLCRKVFVSSVISVCRAGVLETSSNISNKVKIEYVSEQVSIYLLHQDAKYSFQLKIIELILAEGSKTVEKASKSKETITADIRRLCKICSLILGNRSFRKIA